MTVLFSFLRSQLKNYVFQGFFLNTWSKIANTHSFAGLYYLVLNSSQLFLYLSCIMHWILNFFVHLFFLSLKWKLQLEWEPGLLVHRTFYFLISHFWTFPLRQKWMHLYFLLPSHHLPFYHFTLPHFTTLMYHIPISVNCFHVTNNAFIFILRSPLG